VVKLIVDETQSEVVSTSYVWWRAPVLGAIIGLIFFILTLLIGRYIISPIQCGVSGTSACSGAVTMAGNIATVLTAVIGTVILLKLKIARPLLIAAASAVLTWNVAAWVFGLTWYEVLISVVVLYALSYALFSWLSRYSKIVPALIAIVAVLLIARIAIAL